MGKEEIQESEPLRIYLNEIGEIPLLGRDGRKRIGQKNLRRRRIRKSETGRRESSSRRFYRKTLYGKRFCR